MAQWHALQFSLFANVRDVPALTVQPWGQIYSTQARYLRCLVLPTVAAASASCFATPFTVFPPFGYASDLISVPPAVADACSVVYCGGLAAIFPFIV